MHVQQLVVATEPAVGQHDDTIEYFKSTDDNISLRLILYFFSFSFMYRISPLEFGLSRRSLGDAPPVYYEPDSPHREKRGGSLGFGGVYGFDADSGSFRQDEGEDEGHHGGGGGGGDYDYDFDYGGRDQGSE
jgi:hypothetical protein